MTIFIAVVFFACLFMSAVSVNAMMAQYLAYMKEVKTPYTKSVNFFLTVTCLLWGLFYFLTH